MVRWAAILLIAGIALHYALPTLRPGDAAVPLVRILGTAATQHGADLVRWLLLGAAGVAGLATLVWSRSWIQWRRSRVHGAIARHLKIRPELLRVRARWSRPKTWLPAHVRVRYPSGMVKADPSEELTELFALQFGITAAVAWHPQRDGIEITRIPPRPAQAAPPTRLEDAFESVGKLHGTLAPLLPGLTVDQDATRLDAGGSPELLILSYDQTTKDIAPRFRARVQAVLEEKVPSPTGAWAITWRPEKHLVEVRPSEPLPRYALNEGLPADWKDRLSIPLGIGSGGRVLAWQPLKYPHFLISGATGGGKALDCLTPIATPDGWTTMGALQAGDVIFDETGAPCRVLQAHPILSGRPCYEVVFSDGSTLVADADHLWLTETRASRVSSSRGEKREATRGRRQRLSTRQRGKLLALRGTRGITLQEIANAEGRSAPTALLRSTARRVGATGSTHPVAAWVTSSGIGLRRARRAATYPATATIDAYLVACAGLLHDQRHKGSAPAVRTTAEIKATLRAGEHANHSIPLAGPLDTVQKNLLAHPYVLGCWLGDGDSSNARLTSADPELVQRIRDAGYEVGEGTPDQRNPAVRSYAIRGLVGQLRELGVLRNKHIPPAYLRASIEQRRELFAGLLDTDGTVSPSGKAQFDSTVRALAEGALELALSLGLRATITSRVATLNGRDCRRVWRVSCMTDVPLFALSRKREAQATRGARHQPLRTRRRYIVDVRPVPTRPVRCITVDAPSRLYLAGRNLIPTHNTAMIRTVLVMALLQGWRVTLLDPKQTSFQAFAEWPGVERLCITGGDMRDALLNHRDDMQKVYDDLRTGRLTHDQIVPNLLIFDEVTEGFADIEEWIEENFEDLKEAAGTDIKLPREMKRAPNATWRVTRKGREARIWQLLGLQRPDTRFIPGEARDNLITRAAAGQMRGDGLEMMFEDPSVKQRVTERLTDPDSGEVREQHVPGRITIDVGHGPEPMQSFWTPDPLRATGEERQLLETLREAVSDAQIDRLRRSSFSGPPTATAQAAAVTNPAGAATTPEPPAPSPPPPATRWGTTRAVSVRAEELTPGQWIYLDLDGENEAVEVLECVVAEDGDSTLIDYRLLDGEEGSCELDSSELVELAGSASE